jgi:hypothetical protein
VGIQRAVCEVADEYIRSLTNTTLKSYAVVLWDYICSNGYYEPDPTYYGLAPIEVVELDAVLKGLASTS